MADDAVVAAAHPLGDGAHDVSRITLELPSLLVSMLGVPARIECEGATIRAALESACAAHPVLRVHLFDERSALREHVLCFHNETNTRWLPSLDEPVGDGDRLTVIQAVSGG